MTRTNNHSYLPALNYRNPINEPHATRSIVDIDAQVALAFAGRERGGTLHRAKPGVLRLGHVHLKVRSLDGSVPFYTGLLDFRLNERVGRFAFLATGDEHHSIALEEVGDWVVRPSRRAVGVAHIALQAPDSETFAAIGKKLLEAKLPLISRNNGISWAFRFKDPDRNEIEIYVDRRRSPGGMQLWGGRWHLPARSAALIR